MADQGERTIFERQSAGILQMMSPLAIDEILRYRTDLKYLPMQPIRGLSRLQPVSIATEA
jgi:hypothetical protein